MSINKKIFIILIIITTALTIIKVFQLLQPKPATILQSNPAQNSSGIETTLPITLFFNLPLKNNPNVTTTPPFDFLLNISQNKTSLTITPKKSLLEKTNYTIHIYGDGISPLTLYFQTKSTPTPTPSPSAKVEDIKSNTLDGLLLKLPVVSDKYTIQYLSKSDKFYVTILKNPYAENKKEVEIWFKDHGIEDLSVLNIFYNSSRGVAP